MITEYDNLCIMCNKPAECKHHLIFGVAHRELADQDDLIVPLCNSCHNMGKDAIHGNVAAEKLSKILGQVIWESKFGNRAAFIARYGKSYI